MKPSPALVNVARVLVELEYAVADFSEREAASRADQLEVIPSLESLIFKLMEASRAVQNAVDALQRQSSNNHR